MEKHMSHKHTLTLTTSANINTPENAVCSVCHDIIMPSTSVYRCSETRRTSTSNASLDSTCASFFLHKTCSQLPLTIQHAGHNEHLLTLIDFSTYGSWQKCEVCGSGSTGCFVYRCEICISIWICLKCTMQERITNHQLHSHSLTLLPLKSMFVCGACGKKDIDDFSYLCQTCLFWIHKSCALAPKSLIYRLHHHDHPLLLSDSIPKRYNMGGLVCSICQHPFDEGYWIYYCADCRFFAHMKCPANATELSFSAIAREVKYEKDVNYSELVQFPVCGGIHRLHNNLIGQFANACSSTPTTKDRISHCTHGHPLVLINKERRKSIVKLKQLLCYGCFQPLSFPAGPFYGCVKCKYFLHRVCSTMLPGMMEYPFHPTHSLVKCHKIGDSIRCKICCNESKGIFYRCESSSCSFVIDIICASLPRKIKHESHKHFLTQQIIDQPKHGNCNGCNLGLTSGSYFSCDICQFQLHVGCAISPGTVKHRWDEHPLHLTYPPVKQHPHEFDCEFCSKDVNPNYWFYHCRDCDLSLHIKCLKQGNGNLLPKFYRYNLRFPNEQCAIL